MTPSPASLTLASQVLPHEYLASHPPSSYWEWLHRRLRSSARLQHCRRVVGKAPSHKALLHTAADSLLAGKPNPRGRQPASRGVVHAPSSPLWTQQHRAAWLRQQLGTPKPVSLGDPVAREQGSLQSTLQIKAPQACMLNLSQNAKTCMLAGPRTDGSSYSQGKARQIVWRFRACFPKKSHGKERRQQCASSLPLLGQGGQSPPWW